ncbi:MAG: type II secretion system protein GspM [Candidatus Binatia bacterium]
MTFRERWGALSARERYLAIGVVVLAAIVPLRMGFRGSLPKFAGSGDDEAWVQLRKIENYHRILGRSQAAEKRSKSIQERYRAAQQRLIPGITPTEVGAELQGRLSEMASEAGLNVLSSQILREEEVDDFRRIGVRLTLSGSLDGVARLLSSIETGNVDLAVTLLEINRKLGASRRPVPTRPGSTASKIAALTATMEVKTFMQESL